MSLLKAENIKLKRKVEDIETRLLNLIGAIRIFSSGMPGHEHEMNNNIAEIITTGSEIKVVAPFITKEFVMILQDRAKNGVKVQIVINDRRFWPKEHANLYDTLKATNGIDLVNNPNVKYLLVWSPESALFTSRPLSKDSLMNTILIEITKIK